MRITRGIGIVQLIKRSLSTRWSRSSPRIMKHLLTTFFVFNLLASVVTGTDNCRPLIRKRYNSVAYMCTELTDLRLLQGARTNTTSIEISNSNISHVPGHSFERFGMTLVTLDLHGSRVETIDPKAFAGLVRLENLILWGNKLKVVPRDWFVNMHYLKTLDLSFNSIEIIDGGMLDWLPNLENLYFDYNQIRYLDYATIGKFAYLQNLKNVKFERNPLNWGVRAYLTWQLENQRVRYSEDWDDWEWMNVIIKDCTDSGQGVIPKDTILDCAVGKLLDFTAESFSTEMGWQDDECTVTAQQLVHCMRPRNATGNEGNEAARRVLEDYTAILTPMLRSRSRFSVPTTNQQS